MIKADRDNWISAAEVVKRIDKDGIPSLREKWIYAMRCHFQILSIKEARRVLELDISVEQLKELVLEHCHQRELPEPIMWEDGEDLTSLSFFSEPYFSFYLLQAFCPVHRRIS